MIDPEDEDREAAKATPNADGTPVSPVNGKAPSLTLPSPTAPSHARTQTATTIASVATAHTSNSQAEMRKVLEAGEKEQTEADDVKTAAVPKVRIGAEDLSKYGMFIPFVILIRLR